MLVYTGKRRVRSSNQQSLKPSR